MFFSRRKTSEYSALAMTGVREGDRALQVGLDDSRLAAAIAEKVGARGQAAMAVAEPDQVDRAQTAAIRAGVVLDVHLAALDALPFVPDTFDLVVVHAGGVAVDFDELSGRAILCDIRRVLRGDGRIVVLEGGTRDLLRRLSRRRISRSGARLNALRAAGFSAARLLAERDGNRAFEAVKPA